MRSTVRAQRTVVLHSPGHLRQRRAIFRSQSPGHAPATPGTLVGRLEPGQTMQRPRMGGRLGQKLCERQKAFIGLSAEFNAVHPGGGPSLMQRAKCQCIMAPDERFKGTSSFLISCEPLAARRTCKWGAEVDIFGRRRRTRTGQESLSQCRAPPDPASSDLSSQIYPQRAADRCSRPVVWGGPARCRTGGMQSPSWPEVDLISSTTAFRQPAIVASNPPIARRLHVPCSHTRPMPSDSDAVPGLHSGWQRNRPIPSSRLRDTASKRYPPSFLPSSFS